jgi:L-alanine-DL-glutamate epimerase-like enolase superfamily enzyme
MPRSPRITRVAVTHYAYEIADVEEARAAYWTYRSGSRLRVEDAVTVVETDAGISGEAPGAIDSRSARYLLGRDALGREQIWQDLKAAHRGSGNAPPEAADTVLWDLAGKLFDAPVYELLGGGWRLRIPCYASTYHGGAAGGLATPEGYADYARACHDEHGYPAFKIHAWGDPEREVETVLAVREAVGDSVDLMLDPGGAYRTFADVLRVGRACDEAGYFWYEDPFRGGGFSMYAHLKLKEFVKTPLLVGEHIRGLEAKGDLIHSRAADYIRSSTYEEGGITGVMKTAALAEAFGLDVELHGGGLAHRHCMAAIRNSNYYELGLVHPEITDDKPRIYEDPRWLDLIDSVDSDGCVEVPTGPGLGVPIDWAWVDAHKSGVSVYE